MKKLFVLLSIVVLFVSGCSVQTLDQNDIETNMDILLSEKTDIYNVYFDGYKYYVPKGMKILNNDEYNTTFLDRFDNKYYLYVDVVSYYHKTENNYIVTDMNYFSKKFEYNNKSGYINIEKVKDKLFVQLVYNYAKMETYVSERNLVKAVNNMCLILRTVKFNDNILESLVGDNILSYQEENFVLFDIESSNEDVLEVVENSDLSSEDNYFKSDEEIELDEDY